MKYVSLIKFMGFYADIIKEYHGVKGLSDEASRRNPSDVPNLAPLNIELNPAADFEMKDAALRRIQFTNPEAITWVYGSSAPPSFLMLPILEIEWLKTFEELQDDLLSVIEQMAYVYMAHILTWHGDGRRVLEDDWLEMLERCDVCVDVEDLKDTPAIINISDLPKPRPVKIRSWVMALFYENSFMSLLHQCEAQNATIQEIYFHLPILIVMFMLDYHHPDGRLTRWTKNQRIVVEKKLRTWYDGCESGVGVKNSDLYTYAVTVFRTCGDVKLLRMGLLAMLDRLSAENEDIGTITVVEYERICGPNQIRANVRLAGMNILWPNLIREFEAKKTQEAGVDEAEGSEV